MAKMTYGALMNGMINLLIMTWFLVICTETKAQQVSIAPYYGGRQAALSLTFDDGLEDQYTLAFPELKRRGLKATFAIIGSKVGGMMRSKQDRIDGTNGTRVMTWEQLRQMAADGQEIASHGWEHRSVTRLDSMALAYEITANDSAIEKNIGTRPATYFYPGNNKTDETVAFCERDKVGSRTYQLSLGSKRTLPFMKNYVEELIAHGKWGVTMTHGIARGYDHFQDPQVLWDFLDYLVTKREELWIATFRDIAAYRKEAAATTLTVTKDKDMLTITPHCPLDVKLYHLPLTIMIDGKQMVDIYPHGGPVSVRICSEQHQSEP